MGPWYLINNYNWHDFITFRTFSPEHIRSDQASLIFQEVMELEEQHGHEFSGEYNIIAVMSQNVLEWLCDISIINSYKRLAELYIKSETQVL